jgi:hypothetical protein
MPRGLAGNAADRAGLLQRLEVVLRRAHALEAEGGGDLSLRGRHAVGLHPLGDQGQDAALGLAKGVLVIVLMG